MNSSSDDITLGRAVKWLLLAILLLSGIGVAISVMSAATAPIRGAAGVVSRTFDAGNIERTYERFHDLNRGYTSRVAQIRETSRRLAAETDPTERRFLNTELAAQRGSCRDIVAQYNADATKTNREIFRGREAPETLNLSECDQ